MSNQTEKLIDALRSMPAPEPRPGFVERALARATQAPGSPPRRLPQALFRWETWLGAALGGAAAAALTLLLIRPDLETTPGVNRVAIAPNETREIDVLIDSERDLDNATIRIAVTGDIALDGYENEPEIDWQTDLEQGPNLLSLPIVAHGKGGGRLVAVVEHEGKTRTFMIDVAVASESGSGS